MTRILVPMDRSEMAEAALRFACSVHPDSDITVLHVVGGPTGYMGEAAGLALSMDMPAAVEEHAQDVFERARKIADESGVTVTTCVQLGSPIRAIVRCADDFDHIILGSHGRNVQSRILLGNVAATVTRRSPIPVTVVR